jgi:hypothetical protein
MAYQLWVSRDGYRRKGTRASELRKLFDDGITADSIQEPLRACCYNDDAAKVAEELRRLDFDVAGAKKTEDCKIDGFVLRQDLGTSLCSSYVKPIALMDLIAESTPLVKVLNVLRDKPYIFVLTNDEVSGIVTRADLQKPPVRILLFGLISLFEMHLSYLIRKYYPYDLWRDKLTQGRIDKAEALLEQRKNRNEEIDLFSCLQFADKKSLVIVSENIIDILGLSDNKTAENTLDKIEKIRDKLAHSQDLETGTSWEEIIDVSVVVEDMLNRSDQFLEESARCSSRENTLLEN